MQFVFNRGGPEQSESRFYFLGDFVFDAIPVYQRGGRLQILVPPRSVKTFGNVGARETQRPVTRPGEPVQMVRGGFAVRSPVARQTFQYGRIRALWTRQIGFIPLLRRYSDIVVGRIVFGLLCNRV